MLNTNLHNIVLNQPDNLWSIKNNKIPIVKISSCFAKTLMDTSNNNKQSISQSLKQICINQKMIFKSWHRATTPGVSTCMIQLYTLSNI
jgi:hypothetical protein